jgi:hypothetical protein
VPAELPRVRWFDAEPARLAAERAAMAAVAPELVWSDASAGGGWEGLAPVWPFPRPRPPGLDACLADAHGLGRPTLALRTWRS